MKTANHRFTRQKHNHQIVQSEKKVFEPKPPVHVGAQKAPGLWEKFLYLTYSNTVQNATTVGIILTAIALVAFLFHHPALDIAGRYVIGYGMGRVVGAYGLEWLHARKTDWKRLRFSRR